MRLDSVGIDIFDIHGYFCELTVGQRTPGFWGVTSLIVQIYILMKQLSYSQQLINN